MGRIMCMHFFVKRRKILILCGVFASILNLTLIVINAPRLGQEKWLEDMHSLRRNKVSNGVMPSSRDGPEMRQAGCDTMGDISAWRNKDITGEDLKLYDGLETDVYMIRFNTTMPVTNNSKTRLVQKRNFGTFGSAVLNETYGIRACLFINQSRRGLAKLMNDENFKGVECLEKSPKFKNDITHNTALLSFPGAGNTWTRHLLEYISGINTGSVYGDGTLAKEFKGETRTTGVIAVKTHEHYGSKMHRRVKFDRAILLIRQPEDSIISLFNLRLTRSHTAVAKATKFNSTEWHGLVWGCILPWKDLYLGWMHDFKGPLMVLSYSRLRKDFYNELYRLGSFLNISVTYKQLWCASVKQEGKFHRRSSRTNNNVYTRHMLNNMTAAKHELEAKLYQIFGDDALGMF